MLIIRKAIFYAHHQEGYIAHAALFVMFFMHLCKQSNRLVDNFHIRTVHLDIIKLLFIHQLMH